LLAVYLNNVEESASCVLVMLNLSKLITLFLMQRSTQTRP